MNDNIIDELERTQRLYEQGVVNDAFISYADALRRAGRLSIALSVCRKGLAVMPASLRGRILLGRIYLDMGHYQKARDEVESVLTNSPNSFVGHMMLATIFMRQMNYAEARREYVKLRTLNPDHPDVARLGNELSKYSDDQQTQMENTRSLTTLSPSQKASLLLDLLKHEPYVKEFYVLRPDNEEEMGEVPLWLILIRGILHKILEDFEKIGKEKPFRITLELDKAPLLVHGLHNDSLLIVLCEPGTKIGKISLLIRQTIFQT